MWSKSKKLYKLEILVSAGPRKEGYSTSPTVRELGEDAGGIFSTSDFGFFWMADGMSDNPTLFEFSSRFFAKSLGTFFEQAICEFWNKKDRVTLKKIIAHVFNLVEYDWQSRFLERWAIISEKEKIDLLNLLENCGDGTKIYKWATTLIAGFVYNKKQRLELISSGDSAGIIFTKSKGCTFINPNKNNLMMLLESKNNAPPRMTFPIKEYDYFSEFDIKKFVFFTDGNCTGNIIDLLNKLKENESFYINQLKTSRRLTYDDKSLLIGEFIS